MAHLRHTDTLKCASKKKRKNFQDWKKPKTRLLPNSVKESSKLLEVILGR